MQTHVTLTQENDIAYLTFTTVPAGKPATLDLPLLKELDDCLYQIEGNAGSLTAVVVQSANPKYFVVGANINALQELNAESIVPWVQAGHAVFNRLEDLTLPTIAKVTGYALGGGLELALACDFIVASESAQFGQPEATLGMVTGWGASYRLPQRIGVAKAKELCFTAAVIDAGTAHQIGLVNQVGAAADLDPMVEKLLQGFRQCGRLALAQTKMLLNSLHYGRRQQSMPAEATASALCLAAPEAQQRIADFLARRRS